MTNIDLILETLEELIPSFYCDDCLSKQVGITPRQQVNAICNKLNSQGFILRTKALCAQCGHRKLVNSLKETIKSGLYERVPFPPRSPRKSYFEEEEAIIDEADLEWAPSEEMEMSITIDEADLIAEIGKEGSAYETKPVSSLDIEHIRTEIVRMCRHLWHNHRKDSIPRSISRAINSLKEDGVIPSHQANMMLTICGLRNVYVYEEVNLGFKEMTVAESAWWIIMEWWNKTSTK